MVWDIRRIVYQLHDVRNCRSQKIGFSRSDGSDEKQKQSIYCDRFDGVAHEERRITDRIREETSDSIISC